MANPRLFPRMRGVALLLAIAATLSGCATAAVGRSAPPGEESEAVADRGPRVHIWTRDELQTDDRVAASFRLDDDAYVVVVNVGRDGYANVIFPESPDDDGFMRGGRTYRLPAFFPGFPRHTRSDYGRLYTATSSYDQVYDRYAGYVFVVASWRPMHFELSEALGLWDNYRLAAHEERLDPYVVMHRFADQLVTGGSRDYTARFARYAAFNRGFAGQSAFASCSHYSHYASMFGAYPGWAFFGLVNAGWAPIYGYGYYDLGGPGCGTAFGLTVVGFRPRVLPGTTQPPAPVTPPPGTNPPDDTVAMPRTPPAVRSDSGERKPYPRPRSGGRSRTEVAAGDDERIVDVTRESRRQVLQQEERELERARRALARERGYEPSDDFRRSESVRGRRDSGSEPVRARSSSDDNARVRNERPREESRPAERRESAPPRSEPRSEPRSSPRSEPRSQPEARSEPRAEPRGEKPKP